MVGSIIAWIILGGIAGWIASLVMGVREGLLGYIVVGIIGALIGGFLVRLFSPSSGVTGLNLPSLLVAVLGSIVLLALVRGWRRSRV